jgi:hypothetical protein
MFGAEEINRHRASPSGVTQECDRSLLKADESSIWSWCFVVLQCSVEKVNQSGRNAFKLPK